MILNVGGIGCRNWRGLERMPPMRLAGMTYIVEGDGDNRRFILEGTDNPIYEHNMGLVNARSLDLMASVMVYSKLYDSPCIDRVVETIGNDNPYGFKKGSDEYRRILGSTLYAHAMIDHPNMEWEEISFDFERYIQFVYGRSPAELRLSESRYRDQLVQGSTLELERFDFRRMVLIDGVMRTTVDLNLRRIR